MQSNNPVFRNAEGFNGKATQNAYGNQTYPGAGQTYPGYGAPASDPSTWGTGTPGSPVQAGRGARMSIDSVVQKTAISLGLVILTAMATWILTPDIDESIAPSLTAALIVGSGGAFALSLFNSFKRVVSPALVLAFCAFEGVALGALSKVFDVQYPGVVTNAVLGTFAAFAGTLATYKFLNIQVGDRFRTFVVSAMFGIVGLGLLELVLSAFGSPIGLFGFGALGLIMAIAGLVLGVFMLILDFDFVERGIAAGLDERESWRAAFAMTVSLVWIYTNLLRILAIMRN
jgi:uncharacterized YccA/Bax inhibitor family protein